MGKVGQVARGVGEVELVGFVDVSVVLQSGVYALVKKGVVIYVGKAKRLEARISAHRSVARTAARGKTIPHWMPIKGFVFDQIFVRHCHVDDLDRLEHEMINLYKPRYNQSLKNALPVTAPISILNGTVVLNRPRPQIERRI